MADKKVNWLVERISHQAARYEKEIAALENELALRDEALSQLWGMFPAVRQHYEAILSTERHRAETNAPRMTGSPVRKG